PPRPKAGPADGSHLLHTARRNRARRLAGAASACLSDPDPKILAGLAYLGHGWPPPGAAPVAGMKVAIVGAGWAGLAAAEHLTRADCDVTVFEAGATLGG